MPELIIRRVLSNNAVLAAESCSEAGERILVGKGIGFSKNRGTMSSTAVVAVSTWRLVSSIVRFLRG